MFHQTFEPHDLFVICLLMVLEGLLSMDNALVLGLVARRLPEEMRSKALTYGLVGALVFRVLAIGIASSLLRWHGAELIGGTYLLFVAVRHLWVEYRTDPLDRPAVDSHGNAIAVDEQTGRALTERELGEAIAEGTHGQIRNRELDYSNVHSTHQLAFWLTVARIEFTDVVFAVDSILAAIALVGPAPEGTPPDQVHPKLWVVVAGGMGGVVLMRYAAMIFIKLLDRFPRFETAAYLLVILIGAKMVLLYFMNPDRGPARINFNSAHDVAGWIFWGLVVAAFLFGMIPKQNHGPAAQGVKSF